MMTIAEFAEFCGTTKDTLRWYDRKGLLKPAVMGENGYRYYETIQYEEYDLIDILKESGSNLDEIKTILSDKKQYLNGAFFTERLERLNAQIHRLEAMRDLAASMVDGFHAMEAGVPGEPVLLNLPGMWMLQIKLDKVLGRNQDDYVRSLIRLRQLAGESDNVHPYPLGVRLSLEAAKNGELEQTHFYCSAKDGSSPHAVYHPGGPVVTIWHKGLYSDIFSTLDTAFRFIEQRGLEACDAVFEADFCTVLSDRPENTAFLFTIPVVRKKI